MRAEDEEQQEELATEVLNRLTEIFMVKGAEGDECHLPIEALPRMLKDIMEGHPVIIDMNQQTVNVLKYKDVHIKKGDRYNG